MCEKIISKSCFLADDKKYFIFQVLDLPPNQLQWVLNHLGHTLDVHKIHYRCTSGAIERTQIAKILLMQDFGAIGKFANKKLSDIEMGGMLSP